MNRINRLFVNKSGHVLSVFFTAGYPSLHSTTGIIRALANAGADMIEIGMPFSDPMADGPVIQKSSDTALRQGMNMKLLFSQLRNIRKETDIPLLLMGYLNPVMQYGLTRFCEDCAHVGVDGVILPDLPLEAYLEDSGILTGNRNMGTPRDLFSTNNLHSVFLISPQTSPERIRKIDEVTDGFIYMVSSSSTTGIRNGVDAGQKTYFERIRDMKLKNPRLIGFGISDHKSYSHACEYSQGAVIGSAFVNMLGSAPDLEEGIRKFIEKIRGI